jgi:tRNA 2-thiouridine synthesizing protein E
MPTTTYAGHDVSVDADGYFTDPAQWTEAMAPEIAHAAGLTEFGERHRQVVKFMRAQYEHSGVSPAVRALSRLSGVATKDLYELFPAGPAKTAAKIAGVPKPRGCI